jgi:GntP family gluconate:H+ symporter
MVQGNLLLLYAAIAIAVLVVMITAFKVNPFLALIAVSLAMGVSVGMPIGTIVKSFETGVGNVLGHVALVIALGTMLGKMMAESGGADRIAHTLINAFGEKRIDWAMAFVAFIIGIPVFFDVGFVLLIPIAFSVAKRTKTSILVVGIPMVTGLSIVHGLVPPHPAALLAVQAYHADMGKTILYALIVGIPTLIVAGPLFAKLISRYVVPNPDNPLMHELTEQGPARELPGFGITIATILLPVILMLLGSWADRIVPHGSMANSLLRMSGEPVMALLFGVFASFFTLARPAGFTREQILDFTNDSLGPIAAVTLIVGAGAGFGRILMDSGVSNVVVTMATGAHVSPYVLGWMLAALIRVATGSATVGMATASGLVAPVVALGGVSAELMVLATGAGSLILSHVNDGGFWLVQKYFNMTVAETFKTWTVCETIISVMALLMTLGLSLVI